MQARVSLESSAGDRRGKTLIFYRCVTGNACCLVAVRDANRKQQLIFSVCTCILLSPAFTASSAPLL